MKILLEDMKFNKSFCVINPTNLIMIILYSINENINGVVFKEIIGEIRNDNVSKRMSNVIGIGELKSDYPELQGQKLSEENYGKCYIEIEG